MRKSGLLSHFFDIESVSVILMRPNWEVSRSISSRSQVNTPVCWSLGAENTNLRQEALTVFLTSGLFCMDSAALLCSITNRFASLVESKPFKQEVNCTKILPPLVSVICLVVNCDDGE